MNALFPRERLPALRLAISPQLARALGISQGFALLWWLAIIWLQRAYGVAPWMDQVYAFRAAVAQFSDPFAVMSYVNPPWVLILFAPFSLPPLAISTLIQTGLYFAILTAIIFKFGGGLQVVIITLSSFIAFDAVLELNVDWLVCIGLLVPVAYSGPFLLIKPQLALGYYFAFRPRDWLRAGLNTLPVLLLSLLVWGWWPLEMLEKSQTLIVGRMFNIAPLNLLPWFVSLALGAGLALYAYRRRDPVTGILAWLFFTPYIALYSLPLALAMVAIRWPLAATIVSLALWVIFGGQLLLVLLGWGI
jgi:hypothetical protein